MKYSSKYDSYYNVAVSVGSHYNEAAPSHQRQGMIIDGELNVCLLWIIREHDRGGICVTHTDSNCLVS